jgi:hypothetical protein
LRRSIVVLNDQSFNRDVRRIGLVCAVEGVLDGVSTIEDGTGLSDE